MFKLLYLSAGCGWIHIRSADTLQEIEAKRQTLVEHHPKVFVPTTEWKVVAA